MPKSSFNPVVQAIQEIQRYQNSTELLIRRLPFERLVRQILRDIDPTMRIQASALNAIQHAAEDYIVRLFQDTNTECLFARRITIFPEDMAIARKVQELRALERSIENDRRPRIARNMWDDEFHSNPDLPDWEWDSDMSSSSNEENAFKSGDQNENSDSLPSVESFNPGFLLEEESPCGSASDEPDADYIPPTDEALTSSNK